MAWQRGSASDALLSRARDGPLLYSTLTHTPHQSPAVHLRNRRCSQQRPAVRVAATTTDQAGRGCTHRSSPPCRRGTPWRVWRPARTSRRGRRGRLRCRRQATAWGRPRPSRPNDRRSTGSRRAASPSGGPVRRHARVDESSGCSGERRRADQRAWLWIGRAVLLTESTPSSLQHGAIRCENAARRETASAGGDAHRVCRARSLLITLSGSCRCM